MAAYGPPAQELVRHFDAQLKELGVRRGIGRAWAASVKIAKWELSDGTPLAELRDALTWGLANQRWRKRLVAQRAKVLRDVWSEWLEQQNNNGAAATSVADYDAFG